MMEDRFKFRVWCQNKKEWEKDEICISSLGCFHVKNKTFTVTSDAEPRNHIINFCTGLKNKNGKLIYEGDIVIFIVSLARAGYHKTTNTFETLRGYVGINKYNQHCVICNNGEYHIEKAMEFEIFGNIYENPELLEGICATNSTT